MTSTELLLEHISALKHAKNDLLSHKLRREALPQEMRKDRKAISHMERELAGMTKIENLSEIAVEKGKLEKSLPKKKKGEEFPPEFAEILSKIQALAEQLKDGVTYNVLEGKIATAKEELENKRVEYVGLEVIRKEENRKLFLLEKKISEAEECLQVIAPADNWQGKVAALAKECKKATEKTGNTGCKGCKHYSAKLGKCKVMAEWSSRPMHWKIDKMEATLWQA